MLNQIKGLDALRVYCLLVLMGEDFEMPLVEMLKLTGIADQPSFATSAYELWDLGIATFDYKDGVYTFHINHFPNQEAKE